MTKDIIDKLPAEAQIADNMLALMSVAVDNVCPMCCVPKTASTTVVAAVKFLGSVARTLYEKNAKYGDSAANPIRVFARGLSPEDMVRVRIDDKLSRISRGGLGEVAADEDTAADLVGYLALLAALRKKG